MAFGNKGGGCRTGRKYPEQVTVSLTEEHLDYLRRRSLYSMADAMRSCIERCMQDEVRDESLQGL